LPPARQRHAREEALEQNLRLQGQYLDRETGLHYNTCRHYDPDVGRFISLDPQARRRRQPARLRA